MDKLISTRPYKGFKLEDIVYRAGALEMLKWPSRICGHLCYPNGMKIPVALDKYNG